MASASAPTRTLGIVAATILIVALAVGVAVAVLVPSLNEGLPQLTGTNGPDRLSGTASGDISLEGRGGDDRLRALGPGFDSINGGSGDDVLVGGQGGGDYQAGPGDDYVLDTGTDTSSDGFAGGGGDDELIDRAGAGFMVDDAGREDAGRDVLSSGDGNDDLLLSYGADRAWAGPGDDMVQVDVDGEVDRVSCGPGDDTVQFKRREPADRYLGCEHFKVFPSGVCTMTDMDGVDQPNRMGPGLVVGVARERTYVALARAAVRFARHHRKQLADRAVWLFSSGPKGTARSAAEDTPPREFHQLVKLVEPRGEHVFAGSQPDVLSQEDEEAIDAWTEEIAAELLAVQ